MGKIKKQLKREHGITPKKSDNAMLSFGVCDRVGGGEIGVEAYFSAKNSITRASTSTKVDSSPLN